MKIATITYSDSSGGAARAASRLHHALNSCGLSSRMYTKHSSGPNVVANTRLQKSVAKVRGVLGELPLELMRTDNHSLHSLAMLRSRWPSMLRCSPEQVLHLHWINREMMSIEDIGKLKKPIVWTLHDMWPFCGAEHCSYDMRWLEGYTQFNRPASESGLDLNRITWLRKKRAWRKKIEVVAPSRWLADCARRSVLMRDWPVSVVPNVIDTEVWKPIDRRAARSALGLSLDKPLVLFGADGGVGDFRKGFDLLESALSIVARVVENLGLLVFGAKGPPRTSKLNCDIYHLGHLHDDISLKLAYSAADVTVVPSRQEAFGQTASEAHACGCPVVAFDATGLKDVVEHRQTGYLAQPFSPDDLAAGINWVFSDRLVRESLSTAARDRAKKLWKPEVVVQQYLDIYNRVIEGRVD